MGSAIIDVLLKLDHLPARGEDILCKEQKMSIGGCAYNVARTMMNLESPHDLFVPVGVGTYASMIRADLEKRGYKIFAQEDSMDNGYCICLVEKDGERTFLTIEGAESEWKQEWADDLALTQYSAVYIAGYQLCGEQSRPVVDWLEQLTEQTIFFAPGPVICQLAPDIMKRIFACRPVVHLNEKEAYDFTGGSSIEDCLKAIHQKTDNVVIVTLGDKGAIYFDGTAFETIAGKSAAVVDTIGAGDSHIGAVIAGYSQGMSWHDAIQRANMVSACIVETRGAVIEKEEFEEKMKQYR